jgi:hypothetical protein
MYLVGGKPGVLGEGGPHPQPMAAGRMPSRIRPWYGPARGFSFHRETQPVLDKCCVGCHNRKTDRQGTDGRKIADLTSRPDIVVSGNGEYANGEMPLWRPAVLTPEDGARVSTDVGKYAPNEAGVYDVIGGVAEWTTAAWQPPKGTTAPPQVVGKGGSWRDRPKTATPFSKMPARPEMKFVDVVCE